MVWRLRKNKDGELILIFVSGAQKPRKTMQLISKDFVHLGPIPKKFSREGENISPSLEWADVPKNSQELALICEDPDAPIVPGRDHPVVHWLVYNISTEEHGLQEHLPNDRVLTDPFHVYQGRNSRKGMGYMGPNPPEGHGIHHYIFTLYALDAELQVEPGATKAELFPLIQKHTIETAQLIGTYERSLRRTQDEEDSSKNKKKSEGDSNSRKKDNDTSVHP
jgi:hypothetical protein